MAFFQKNTKCIVYTQRRLNSNVDFHTPGVLSNTSNVYFKVYFPSTGQPNNTRARLKFTKLSVWENNGHSTASKKDCFFYNTLVPKYLHTLIAFIRRHFIQITAPRWKSKVYLMKGKHKQKSANWNNNTLYLVKMGFQAFFWNFEGMQQTGVQMGWSSHCRCCEGKGFVGRGYETSRFEFWNRECWGVHFEAQGVVTLCVDWEEWCEISRSV